MTFHARQDFYKFSIFVGYHGIRHGNRNIVVLHNQAASGCLQVVLFINSTRGGQSIYCLLKHLCHHEDHILFPYMYNTCSSAILTRNMIRLFGADNSRNSIPITIFPNVFFMDINTNGVSINTILPRKIDALYTKLACCLYNIKIDAIEIIDIQSHAIISCCSNATNCNMNLANYTHTLHNPFATIVMLITGVLTYHTVISTVTS